MEITCWNLIEQEFVVYIPWMHWCPYIIIFVDGLWWRPERFG